MRNRMATCLLAACLAPLAATRAAGSWVSPGIRLTGAVPRGETLVLRLHQDIAIEQFSSGDFRLTETESDPDAERGETFQRLTLLGGAISAAAK